MKITAWKFGNGNVTVKYETEDGAYTFKTEDDPKKSLYTAAVEVAKETNAALGFNFDVSLSSMSIGYSDNPSAAIVLDTGTSINECAQVKCPKINRKKHLDYDAETQILPGMEANTISLVYQDFIGLNLAIDVFLKEAEAFVLSKPKRELNLFDEQSGGNAE